MISQCLRATQTLWQKRIRPLKRRKHGAYRGKTGIKLPLPATSLTLSHGASRIQTVLVPAFA